MKRTQQSVLLATLALSLAACSYMPWRNTSGTTPAANPSSGAPTSGSNPATDPGPNAANSSASDKSTSDTSGASK